MKFRFFLMIALSVIAVLLDKIFTFAPFIIGIYLIDYVIRRPYAAREHIKSAKRSISNLIHKNRCDVCNGELKLAYSSTLRDGQMCRSCESQISPNLSHRHNHSVQEMKEHINYNIKRNAEPFVSSIKFEGLRKGDISFFVDENTKKLK